MPSTMLRETTRRLAILLAAVSLVALAVWLPRPEKHRRLRLASGLWPGSEAMVLAHARGELPNADFQMIELPWSSAVMRALGNDAADAAVVTLDVALRMRESGQDLRVVMALDESAEADVVLAGGGLAEMKALRGRRIGVDVRGAGGYVLANALEGAGMTLSDVVVVPMIQAEMEQAVADGLVDAVASSEPWASRLRSAGLREVSDVREPKVPVMRVLVASARACEELRPQLSRLIAAQIEGTKRMRAKQPFAGMEVVMRRQKLDAEQLQTALGRWTPFDLEANRSLLDGDPPKLAEMADEMTSMMLRCGLLKSEPGNETWIDGTLLGEVRP